MVIHPKLGIRIEMERRRIDPYGLMTIPSSIHMPRSRKIWWPHRCGSGSGALFWELQKQKWTCAGKKWSWPTKGSKTVVKRVFLNKNNMMLLNIFFSLSTGNFRWQAQWIAAFKAKNTVLQSPPHEVWSWATAISLQFKPGVLHEKEIFRNPARPTFARWCPPGMFVGVKKTLATIAIPIVHPSYLGHVCQLSYLGGPPL